MPIQSDLSIPVFSYVGRLRDSRKGLDLFLDALVILWDQRPRQPIKAWVIGGSAEDEAWALQLAACRPTLKARLLSGDLIFWGRIESGALAEFYSRSTALVVPSFREQFCLAAVEAMMCGCPVIAARVGGLQDVVVDGRTGSLFDRGSATALVGVLGTYIDTPALPRWMGTNAALWARACFSAQAVYSSLESVLEDSSAQCRQWLFPSEAEFTRTVITQSLPAVESLLSGTVSSFEDLTSSQSVSFMVQLTDARKAFVKLYSDRPTYFSCLHRTHYSGDPRQLPRERLRLALRLRGRDFFPAVLAHDLNAALIVQEWLPPAQLGGFPGTRDALNRACRAVQSYDPAPETLPFRDAICRRLADCKSLDIEILKEIDELGALAHSSLVGGAMRARRLHPQLELFRLSVFLGANSFWLPQDYVTRAQAQISLLLSLQPLIATPPTFAHGSLKVEHLLTPQPVLCDFDHAGYFCGPIDAAHWIWHYFLHTYGSHPGAMLRQLKMELKDAQAFYLGACWLLAFQLNRDFVFLSRGDSSTARATMTFLYEFSQSLSAA